MSSFPFVLNASESNRIKQILQNIMMGQVAICKFLTEGQNDIFVCLWKTFCLYFFHVAWLYNVIELKRKLTELIMH